MSARIGNHRSIGAAAQKLWGPLLLATVWGWFGLAILLGQPENVGTLIFTLLLGLAAPALIIAFTLGAGSLASPSEAKPWTLMSVVAYLALSVSIAAGAQVIASEVRSTRGADLITHAAYILSWAAIPGCLFLARVWRWPAVGARVGGLRLMLVAALCIPLALYDGANGVTSVDWTLSDVQLAICLVLAVLIGFSEEFVFRVMLLSHMAAWLKSSTNAVAVSSLIFGLLHVPVLLLDGGSYPWRTLQQGATSLTAIGVLLGVVWVRTRSFALTGLIHTAFNLFLVIDRMEEVWGAPA